MGKLSTIGKDSALTKLATDATHVALFVGDPSSGGNVVAQGSIVNAQAVAAGVTVSLGIGQVEISVENVA